MCKKPQFWATSPKINTQINAACVDFVYSVGTDLLHFHRCVVFCTFNPPVNNRTSTGTEKGLTSELLMKQDVHVKGFVVNNRLSIHQSPVCTCSVCSSSHTATKPFWDTDLDTYWNFIDSLQHVVNILAGVCRTCSAQSFQKSKCAHSVHAWMDQEHLFTHMGNILPFQISKSQSKMAQRHRQQSREICFLFLFLRVMSKDKHK